MAGHSRFTTLILTFSVVLLIPSINASACRPNQIPLSKSSPTPVAGIVPGASVSPVALTSLGGRLPTSAQLSILPFGDSITEGYGSSDSCGYRELLVQALTST